VFDPALRRRKAVGAGFFAVSGNHECAPPKQRAAHAKRASLAEAPWLSETGSKVKAGNEGILPGCASIPQFHPVDFRDF